jgi:hypothetical protein
VDNGRANGRAKPGPKPKMTPVVKADILLSLRLGLSIAEALRCADVSYDNFRHAKRTDEQFARGVKSAADRGKRHHLQRVHDGVPQWQSSAWFLERKYGAEFGQRVKVQSSGRVVIKAVAGASLGDL